MRYLFYATDIGDKNFEFLYVVYQSVQSLDYHHNLGNKVVQNIWSEYQNSVFLYMKCRKVSCIYKAFFNIGQDPIFFTKTLQNKVKDLVSL